MAPHLRKTTGNPLPAAPAGVHKDQFTRAMAEAARQVTQALGLYADPVNVLPEAHQPEVPLCGREWTKMTIAGVPVEVRSTGGDGLFMGVAVDTGQMMRFNLEAGRRAFHFPLEE